MRNLRKTIGSFFMSKKKLLDENFLLHEEIRKLIEKEKQLQILNINLKRESQEVAQKAEKKYLNTLEQHKKLKPKFQEKCQELNELKKKVKELERRMENLTHENT